MKKFTALILTLTIILGSSVFVFAKNGDFVIVHTTDIHGRYEGFGAIASIVNGYRTSGDDVMVLDSGDLFHGLPFANLERGESIAEIVKAIDYDAMTTGNHDYNFGKARLQELAKKAELDILCANVVDEAGANIFTPYKIFSYNGFNIGVLGLANVDTKEKTAPDNTQGITFLDPIETAKKYLPEIEQKADFIVALTHIGSIPEKGETSLNLGEKINGIDLILDGHSHNLNNGIKAGNATLVSSGNYTNTVSVITVSKDKNITVEQKTITKEMDKESNVTNIITEINEKQKPLLSEVIGKAPSFLNGEYPVIRNRETNLGKLITNSYRYVTKADFALENGGGIRNSILLGDITKNDIYSVQPFGNYLMMKEITGKDFKQIIKNSLPNAKLLNGSFLQISGADIQYNGEDVISVKVNGSEIEDTKIYTIAANNYVGTTYDILKDAKLIGEFGATDEALIEYIKSGKDVIDADHYLTNQNSKKTYQIMIDGYASETESKSSQILPFRVIFELLKYDVSWNNDLNVATASLDDKKVEVRIGEDGQIIDNRTMISVEKAEELTGRKVYIDDSSKSVIFWK